MAVSNSIECMREFVGGTVIGAVFDAFGEGTRTFLFLGGRAFTFNAKGGFCEESADKVKAFFERMKKQFELDKQLLDSMAEHAPWAS